MAFLAKFDSFVLTLAAQGRPRLITAIGALQQVTKLFPVCQSTQWHGTTVIYNQPLPFSRTFLYFEIMATVGRKKMLAKVATAAAEGIDPKDFARLKTKVILSSVWQKKANYFVNKIFSFLHSMKLMFLRLTQLRGLLTSFLCVDVVAWSINSWLSGNIIKPALAIKCHKKPILILQQNFLSWSSENKWWRGWNSEKIRFRFTSRN